MKNVSHITKMRLLVNLSKGREVRQSATTLFNSLPSKDGGEDLDGRYVVARDSDTVIRLTMQKERVLCDVRHTSRSGGTTEICVAYPR